MILDSRSDDGRGLWLEVTPAGAVQIALNDGRTECRWDCDPGLLKPRTTHHVAAIVDSGAGIISFVVDGALCDGGDRRQFGWGRLNPHLRDAAGAGRLTIGPEVRGLRIYDRALLTSEAIGNFQADRSKEGLAP